MTPAIKRAPLRTCILCGSKTSKKSLARIVATPDGGARIDSGGRLPGRGAYMCGDVQCSPSPARRGRIESALRRRITDDDWRTLEETIAGRGE